MKILKIELNTQTEYIHVQQKVKGHNYEPDTIVTTRAYLFQYFCRGIINIKIFNKWPSWSPLTCYFNITFTILHDIFYIAWFCLKSTLNIVKFISSVV